MIHLHYDEKYNAVIIEFVGKIDKEQGERYFLDLPGILPEKGKDFKLLVDLSCVESMDLEIQEFVVKAMDLFNARGVTKVVRIIPDPAKDIGLNILSIFHYDKRVKIFTVESREEAMERLR